MIDSNYTSIFASFPDHRRLIMDFGYEDEELLDGKECTTMASA